VGTPVFFHARFLLTAETQEPGIRVEKVSLAGVPLENDSRVVVGNLARGLRISCSAPLAPEPFARLDGTSPQTVPPKPVCVVTLDLPYPLNSVETEFLLAEGFVGFQPLIVASTVTLRETEIFWAPEPKVGAWLINGLRTVMERRQLTPILAHLVLKGNAIWQRDRPDVFLDGNAFSRAERDGRVGLTLPSGDGRRGGDFEMWFWLEPSQTIQQPGIVIEAAVVRNAITGSVKDATGAPLPGLAVTLTGGPATQTAQTTTDGSFRFTGLGVGNYTLRAQAGGAAGTAQVTVAGVLGPPPAPPTPVRPESAEAGKGKERKTPKAPRAPRKPKGPKG
jgi:hypothetical protein